jgi:hypothetical protein
MQSAVCKLSTHYSLLTTHNLKMLKQTILVLLLAIGFVVNLKAQTDTTTRGDLVDVVWLKGGSRLTGTILKWELARGMEFKLATGAEMIIPKSEIEKVYQDVSIGSAVQSTVSLLRGPRPYAFKEQGLYQSFSLFLNFADPGGAGIQYSIGHRFNRLLGVGIGLGLESNDFFNNRGMVPVFAEARGYFRSEKISPYYAFKLGYGFALKNNYVEEIDAKGGIYVSPEIGIRFGGRAVNYYLGMEYKIQKATYVNSFGWEGTSTDKLTYKRVELRTGIVF